MQRLFLSLFKTEIEIYSNQPYILYNLSHISPRNVKKKNVYGNRFKFRFKQREFAEPGKLTAQLVQHRHGNLEVPGSNPIHSKSVLMYLSVTLSVY